MKRFVIFRDRFQMLTGEEKEVIDMVLNSFGIRVVSKDATQELLEMVFG